MKEEQKQSDKVNLKKNIWVIALSACLALAVTACTKKAAQAKVETVEGVTLIHNPATPLHPNKAVTFEEEFTYRETDAAGVLCLFKPGSFTVGAQGNVYIADDSDMAIKILDAKGKYLSSIGRQGNGPGEFMFIRDIFLLPDGRLLVTDFQARRTSFFDHHGQFLSSYAWKKHFDQVYLVTDESCTLEESVFIGEMNERRVRKVGFNGEEKLSFGKFTNPAFESVRIGGGMAVTWIPWSPASVFTGDRNRQWLYHCPGDKYLIEVYDQEAKLFRKIDRPYECVVVTSEDIDKLKARFADKPDSPIAKIYQKMRFPKVKQVSTRLYVNGDGSL